MSNTKTITLSMQSLNKLYFQFFERFVTPNLLKTVNEITQLLKNRTAYEVYKYLEELFSKNENNDGHTSNQVISTLNASISGLTSAPTHYQYALPTNGEHPKSAHTEHLKSFDKEKGLEDGMNFKGKLGVRRTMTGLAFDEPPKTFEFRNYSDEANQSPSIYTNHSSITSPPLLSNDFKLDFQNNKDPLSLIPSLSRLDSGVDQQSKAKTMKDIVRKIGKLFNENHSKIEKYNKNSSQTNKLFNINTSTRLDKKEEGRKQYQFLTKIDLLGRKY